MRFAGSLPHFSSYGGLFPRPLGLALGSLHPLAGPLELLFGDPDALPRDLRLQPRALERLFRLTRRGCAGTRFRRSAIRTVCRLGRWRAGGSFFAGSLPHRQMRVAREDQFHTMAAALPPLAGRGLVTFSLGADLPRRQGHGSASVALPRSARARGQHRGGNAVAAGILAAVEGGVGDLEYLLG